MRIKNVLITGWILFLASCGSDSAVEIEAKAPDNQVSGSFVVLVDGVKKFDSQSNRAKVHIAKENMLGFKAQDWHLRIHGLNLPDSGAGKTTKLGRNNVMFSAMVEINGKKQLVGCNPAKNPVGFFNRTELTAETISGDFSVEFVACEDYYTTKAVAYPSKPFTVSGHFTDIKLK